MAEIRKHGEEDGIIGKIGPSGLEFQCERSPEPIDYNHASETAIAILEFAAGSVRHASFAREVKLKSQLLNLAADSWEDLARRIMNTNQTDWARDPVFYVAVAREIAQRAREIKHKHQSPGDEVK